MSTENLWGPGIFHERRPDEDLDELDDEAMKYIVHPQMRRSIVLMVSLSSPLFLEGANFLGTGSVLRVVLSKTPKTF